MVEIGSCAHEKALGHIDLGVQPQADAHIGRNGQQPVGGIVSVQILETEARAQSHGVTQAKRAGYYHGPVEIPVQTVDIAYSGALCSPVSGEGIYLQAHSQLRVIAEGSDRGAAQILPAQPGAEGRKNR